MRRFIGFSLATTTSATSVVAAPASGYQKLIDLFTNLKTEAEGTETLDSAALTGLTETCNTEIDGLSSQIESTTEALNDAIKKEEAAILAVKGAEEDLADEEKQQGLAEAGLASLESSYSKNDARMGYDLGQLRAAVTGLDQAASKAAAHPGLTAEKAGKLKSMIVNLKGKMNQDMLKLETEKTNGATFYAENKKSMQDKIAAHVLMVGEIGTRLSTQKGIQAAQNAAKVQAQSALNNLQTSKREKIASCKEGQDALNASIKDAAERVAALDSALKILGEGANLPGKEAGLIQEVAKEVSQPLLGFLQMRKGPNRQPLMNFLEKHSSAKGEVRSLVQAALDLNASPAQVDAFKKINAEIEKLLNAMHQQMQDDESDRSWCKQKENELNLQIKDAQTKLSETSTKLDGLNAKADAHDGKVKAAKKQVNSLLEASVNDHKGLMKDLDENKVELEQLHKDLSNLEQAKITLSNKFTGRSESTGAIVMEEIEKVLEDYNKAIITNEQGRRSLEAAVESTAKEYESRLTQTKSNQKRNEVQLETTSEKALATEDLKRQVNTQLKTLQKTFASIFTAEDGKCLNYTAMFSSRKDARATEMQNLNDAKGALAAYCESIGIRI